MPLLSLIIEHFDVIILSGWLHGATSAHGGIAYGKILFGFLFVIIALLVITLVDFIIEQNRIDDDVDPKKKAESERILEMYRDIYSKK